MRRKRLKPEEIKPEHMVADDHDLNGAIGAAVGGTGGEPELPPDPKPEIQPGKTPSIEDAFADMSKPPPAPPAVLLVLDRSSSPPKGAFRVQLRQGTGVFLWMFATPYGESQTGEPFVHPIVASLRSQILLECPALIPVRYEIRLVRSAIGKFSLLEIPADPMKTKKAEATRQSLLQVIEYAERRSTRRHEGTRGGRDLVPAGGRSLFPMSGPSRASSSWSAPPTKPTWLRTWTTRSWQRFRLKAQKTD